jgi:hypothetical protein
MPCSYDVYPVSIKACQDDKKSTNVNVLSEVRLYEVIPLGYLGRI